MKILGLSFREFATFSMIIATAMAALPGPLKNSFILLAIFFSVITILDKSQVKKSTIGWMIWLLIFPVCMFFVYGYQYGGDTAIFFCYLGIAVNILIGINSNDNITEITLKLIILFVIIEAMGVFFQWIAPEFYFDNLSKYLPQLFETLYFRYKKYGYMSGFTTEVSFVAGFLCIGVFLLFFKLLISKKNNRKLTIFLLIIVVAALILTKKRAHLVFCIVSCFFTYYFTDNSKRKSKWMFNVLRITLILIILFFIIYYFYGGSNSAVGRIVDSIGGLFNGEDITSSRTDFNKYTIAMWFEKPLLGYGWGTYRVIGLSELGLHCNAHNVYLQLLAETGIVGFFSFVILALFSLKRGVLAVKKIDITDNQKLGVCIGLSYQMFFLLYCFTGNCLYEANFYLPYFISIMYAESVLSQK